MSLKTSRKKYNPELVDYVSTNLDDTPTKKYTEKLCQYIVDDETLYNETNEGVLSQMNALSASIKLFDRYSKNMEKKDIYQYKTSEELFDAIIMYINKFNNNKVRQFIKQNNNGELECVWEHKTYKIYKIYGFEDAVKFSGHCNWCVTKTRYTFDNYTSKDQQFYFAIDENYKNITPDKFPVNAPIDKYGTSMIALRVYTDGKIEKTSRWNHEYSETVWEKNSHILNDLFGLDDVTTILKPKIVKPKIDESNKIHEIINLRLKLKIPYQRIFKEKYEVINNHAIVRHNGKENFIVVDENRLLLKDWADTVYNFKLVNNGKLYATIINNGKEGLLNSEGVFLTKDKYDTITSTYEGKFYIVQIKNKLNTLSLDGELINDIWFDKILLNSNGYYVGYLGQDKEYINKNGQIIKKQ